MINYMEPRILQPSRKKIDVKGKMFYREFDQAWSTIRLKKEIFNEFTALKEKRSAFSYNVQFYWNYKDFERELRKMKREKKPLPMLLYFVKESENS